MDQIRNEFHSGPERNPDSGAWGRYPSHSRAERTGPAGADDSVATRDFELEAAISFASGGNLDPSQSQTSPDEKKHKKGLFRASHQSLGKQIAKGYEKLFRPRSTEFFHFGPGHRTSIAAGGDLEYPELEMIPEVFSRRISSKEELSEPVNSPQKIPASPSEMTHPRSSVGFDGPSELSPTSLDARTWSAYYSGLLDGFPTHINDSNGNRRSHLAQKSVLRRTLSLDSIDHLASAVIPARKAKMSIARVLEPQGSHICGKCAIPEETA